MFYISCETFSFFPPPTQIDFGCCPLPHNNLYFGIYLMCERVVCDGTRGGVDAEQPPHIDDPVRWNPLNKEAGKYGAKLSYEYDQTGFSVIKL